MYMSCLPVMYYCYLPLQVKELLRYILYIKYKVYYYINIYLSILIYMKYFYGSILYIAMQCAYGSHSFITNFIIKTMKNSGIFQ